MVNYKVPASGLAAAMENAPEELDSLAVALILQAFIRWQSENPIEPTREQLEEMEAEHRNDCNLWNRFGSSTNPAYYCWQWQRRMHLAPAEPEVPKEIEDLLMGSAYTPMTGVVNLNPEWDKKIIEAYRRGQQSKI